LSADRPAELVFIRHAIAEDRGVFARTGRPDGERPLTEKGIRRMRLAARGLREELTELAVLATSPLVRAVETAEILAEAFDGIRVERVAALSAGPPEAFLDWYRSVAGSGTVAAVGHEPHLGAWASWLLAGPAADFVPFKKGGACLLEFPGRVEPGAAVLRWHLGPSHLRALGGRA
jgi:phosphohistidine phosphatase